MYCYGQDVELTKVITMKSELLFELPFKSKKMERDIKCGCRLSKAG